jgi:hypothetical protein
MGNPQNHAPGTAVVEESTTAGAWMRTVAGQARPSPMIQEAIFIDITNEGVLYYPKTAAATKIR